MKFNKLGMLSALFAVAVASAVNFTSIAEIITAIIEIFDPLLNLVIAIVPLIITLALVGFIIKLLDLILDTISKKTKNV